MRWLNHVGVDEASQPAQKTGLGGALLAIQNQNWIGSTRMQRCKQIGDNQIESEAVEFKNDRSVSILAPRSGYGRDNIPSVR